MEMNNNYQLMVINIVQLYSLNNQYFININKLNTMIIYLWYFKQFNLI